MPTNTKATKVTAKKKTESSSGDGASSEKMAKKTARSAASKPTAARSTTAKTATTAKKPAAKKKVTARKTPAKKTVAKKTVAKKTVATKKGVGKPGAAKKVSSKKTAAKETVAKTAEATVPEGKSSDRKNVDKRAEKGSPAVEPPEQNTTTNAVAVHPARPDRASTTPVRDGRQPRSSRNRGGARRGERRTRADSRSGGNTRADGTAGEATRPAARTGGNTRADGTAGEATRPDSRTGGNTRADGTAGGGNGNGASPQTRTGRGDGSRHRRRDDRRDSRNRRGRGRQGDKAGSSNTGNSNTGNSNTGNSNAGTTHERRTGGTHTAAGEAPSTECKDGNSGGEARSDAGRGRQKNKRGRSRRSARSGQPRLPAGPPGLVYVLDANAPIGAVGSLRVFYRQETPEGRHHAILHPVPVDRQLPRRSRHPLDHRVAAVLVRLPKQGRKQASNKRGWKQSQKRRPPSDQRAVTVTEKTWRTLLPWLVESGRFFATVPGTHEAVPVVREELSPLEFHLLIEKIRKRGDYHLTCRFLRNGRTLLYKSQLILITEGEKGWLLRRSGKLSEVDFSGSVAWLRALRRGRFRHVPRRKVSSLLKIFERSTTLPPIHFPTSLKVTRSEGSEPRPELKLESGPQEVTGEVTFRYGDDVVRAARPGRRFFSLKSRRLIERNLDTEGARAVELLQGGFYYDSNAHTFSLSADLLASAAPELFERGWTLHGKRMPFRPPTDMDVDVTTGPDYIEVAVTVHFGDQSIELPQLLEAMKEGSRMIGLKQGAVGVLPSDWLEKNAGWMELGRLHDGKLRFRQNQSALIDALAADKIRARLDQGFRAERARLQNFEGVEECDPAEGFAGDLRPYQRFGLGWLRFLDQMSWGGCLADDMGLGKTVQALALVHSLRSEGREGPTLVVTPKSLIFNWIREAKRFTPDFKVTAYAGPKRSQIFEKLSEYDLILTTYGTLRRDAEKLADVHFFYLILDEAQAIKNADSQNAKAATLLSGERRLILSGTPVENHLGELWSLFDFINPGMLGTYAAFKRRFAGDRGVDSSSLEFLRRTLRPFILRRKKEEVAPDLPPRVEETIMCEMDAEQKKIYAGVKAKCRNSVLDQVSSKGIGRSKLHILEALLRMRQAACHPALISDEYRDTSSGKINAALSMLDEVEDAEHKVLIFSQFTSLLALLREQLEARGKVLGKDYEYLDGQTRDRAAPVDHFQADPDCRIFLISLKAGGLGLNLTAADYVFILDPWWNPAVEAQAIDRAHRIGQENKVFAYRFVSQNTIEERIADLQESKRKLADAIVTADESFVRDLTKEDLEALFS